MLQRLLATTILSVLAAACHSTDTAPPAAPAPTPQSLTATATLVEIVPGVSVGPIRLGMLRAEVDGLRILRRHPRWSGRTVPYQVAYDDGDRVALVQVSLLRAPGDVRVGGAVLPRGTTFLRAKELLGDCTEPEIGFGGGSFSCRGDLIEVTGGSGEPAEIWIGTHPRR